MVTAGGCDSVVKNQIVILEKTFSEFNTTSCFFYSSPSGKNYTETGSYLDTILNSQGCDSILTIQLTIDTVNTNVRKEQRTLSANATENVVWYNWTLCNQENNSLSNGSERMFTPEREGWYSLLIKQGNCVDTSECQFIGSASLDQNITLGPNLTFYKVFVTLEYNFDTISYIIHNAIGEKIEEMTYSSVDAFTIDMSQYASGIYSLKVFDNSEEVTKKIINIR